MTWRRGFPGISYTAKQTVLDSHTEHQEQADLIKWAEAQAGGVEALRYLVAIPNGGARHIHTAVNLKAEGVRAGFPDLILAWPIAPYYVLFIEMKRTKGGKLSDDQRGWLQGLQKRGYACAVCKGFDEAKE